MLIITKTKAQIKKKKTYTNIFSNLNKESRLLYQRYFKKMSFNVRSEHIKPYLHTYQEIERESE